MFTKIYFHKLWTNNYEKQGILIDLFAPVPDKTKQSGYSLTGFRIVNFDRIQLKKHPSSNT